MPNEKKSDYVLTSDVADWVEEVLGMKLHPWQRPFGKRVTADAAWEFTLDRKLEHAAENGMGVAEVREPRLRAAYELPEIPVGEIYHFPSREAFDLWRARQVAA